jgi:hypothetical protein
MLVYRFALLCFWGRGVLPWENEVRKAVGEWGDTDI